MASAAPQPFQPPAIPWRQPRTLEPLMDLGPGVDPQVFGQALARLCAEPDVLAVLAFGSRARGHSQEESDLDLAVIVLSDRQPPSVHDLADLALLAERPLEGELLALQVFAVEARYEEGPFPLPAPRQELLALLEGELGRCEQAVEGSG